MSGCVRYCSPETFITNSYFSNKNRTSNCIRLLYLDCVIYIYFIKLAYDLCTISCSLLKNLTLQYKKLWVQNFAVPFPGRYQMGCDATKPVFRVSDKVSYKPVPSATETS